MALFSLTDIKFLPSDNRGSNLTDFNLNNKRYPIDLGSTDKGHYIMFYIFTQNRTQVGQTSQTNTSQNFQNIDSAGFTVASDIDDLSIGLENTATSDTEFDLANGDWGTEDTTGIDDTGSGGTIGGA